MKGLSLLLILIIAQSCFAQNPKRTLKIVNFEGSGYEIGLQHGKELKNEIADIIVEWKKNTSEILKKDADEILKDFYAYANFEKDIKKWTPELYEEVRGIADGSNQKFKDVLILNLLDEFWVYVDNINNHHCSSVGVPARKGNPGYLSQNMDLESYTDGFQVLMKIAKTETNPEQLILTYPGLIGLIGLNEKGIGVVVNTLMQLEASSEGLPVAFVIRHLINMTDKEKMLDFIKNVKHASGQNYILGIKGEIYDFEASTNKVVLFDPGNKNGTVYHTNHPLVNDNVKPWFKKYAPNKPKDSVIQTNSHYRFVTLEKRLANTENISDQTIIETLSSKENKQNPVCRTNSGGNGLFTFSSVIMTLSNSPVLKITAGPPDESDYQTFNFKTN